MKLTHVRLLVDDFPACFRFYRDVMRLTPTWGEEDEGYADFDTRVDHLDGVLADLRARGAEPGPVTERPDWGIRVTHFRDPAGNLIEVNESVPMVER